MNYQIEDKTGTLNCTIPTWLGHIVQHIEWGKEYLNWGNVQYEFRNFAEIWYEKLRRMGVVPITENEENYCSFLHSKRNRPELEGEWEFIFNYLLWDCAVSYCFAASENGGNQKFSAIAAELFGDLMRLRVNLERAKYRKASELS